ISLIFIINIFYNNYKMSNSQRDNKATPLESLPCNNENPNVQMNETKEYPREHYQQPEQAPVYIQQPIYHYALPPSVSYYDKLKKLIFEDYQKFIMLVALIFISQLDTINSFVRMGVRMLKVPDNMVFTYTKLLSSVIVSLVYLLLQ
ncbi:MAG: hypothetical protein MUO21_09185, partial [Nitrososphaeraceae archaeon]|nr:hypothetical protein [Nitrososphaeraceae archaeon]